MCIERKIEVQAFQLELERELVSQEAPVFAALDLGTNNCRLLVARPAADGFRVIDAFSRIVRLGEGVAEHGRLSHEAMERTLEALGVCADKIRRRGVAHVRAVATEACRRAENAPMFIARVEAETGLSLEVIDTQEEARLAVVGCLPLLANGGERAITFDIGGGSSQITWLAMDGVAANGGAVARITASVSLPCGVVTLAEKFGSEPDSYDVVCDYVAGLLAEFDQAHDIRAQVDAGGVQMLGMSGTVTTLGGVLLDLPRYDRAQVDGLTMSFEEVRAISNRLSRMDYDSRAAVPCVGVDRADLVIVGCAVLKAICETWPAGELRVADRGLREGILLGLLDNLPSKNETPVAQ